MTRPPCSTTNHREESPGACFKATGIEKLRLGNTRAVASAVIELGRSGAIQEVLLGL
jgi:hypothetical protein